MTLGGTSPSRETEESVGGYRSPNGLARCDALNVGVGRA